MIDQKNQRDPLYPQGFEDIDNLKKPSDSTTKTQKTEDNDLKILKNHLIRN